MFTSLSSKKELHSVILMRIAETEHLIKWVKFSLCAPKEYTTAETTNNRKALLVSLLKELEAFAALEFEVRTEIECIETNETLKSMGTAFRKDGRVFFLLP